MTPHPERYRIWLAGVALAVSVVLALVLRDFVREFIVVPIAQFLWLINLYLRAVPQPVLWGIFLTATLYVSVGSLSDAKNRGRRRKEPPPTYAGPVETELKWVRLSSKGSYGRWRLAQRLSELEGAAFALRTHETEYEAKRFLASSEWNGPSEMRAYFRAGLGPPITRPGLLPFGSHAASLKSHPLLTTNPADVVAFIEHELEEEYDR